MKTKKTSGVWIAAAASVLLFSHGLHAAPRSNEGQTLLKGFPPHSEIGYVVRSAKEQLAQGRGTIGADGRFVIPAPGKIRSSALPVSYTVEVTEPGRADPLYLTLTMQSGDGGLSLKARGLEHFARIETRGASSGTAEIRSDWSGILEKGKAGTLEDIVAEDGFEIAFMDGNLNDGVPEKNSRLILVQAGGIECADGEDPPISLCRPGQLATMNENTKIFIIDSMRRASQQLSAVMMQTTAIFGKLLDAKMQLETQALFQRQSAQAHKDYHPSEQMCQFGSFMRSVAKAEEKSELQKIALSRGLMVDYTNRIDSSTSTGAEQDKTTRFEQFRKYYCNPKDNNGELSTICVGTAAAAVRQDRDIDFARLVAAPLTLDIDFSTQIAGTEQETEEDILALGRNLYWSDALNPAPKGAADEDLAKQRRLAAIMNVAHSSYAGLVGMKAKETAAVVGGSTFMKALLREFGLSPADINKMLGDNPGYYAQMEVLAKKIYQSPDFYTNLYDKPVNVDRVGVSLDAIKLMQTRDMYDAALRREMLTSLMVEEALPDDGTAHKTP
ncbi:MAG: hypothetical protein ACT4OY_03875 [Alphaproteobacteria bacterium]